MTDSCSDTEEIEAIADMAGELIHTKMEMARKDTQMTHVMRIGTFHMELVPDEDIDVENIFNEMLNKLNPEIVSIATWKDTHYIMLKLCGPALLYIGFSLIQIMCLAVEYVTKP